MKRFKFTKGSPWYTQMTPLTQEQETSIRLPIMTALKRLEDGKADSYDIGVLMGNFRVCKHLVKWFDDEEKLMKVLCDGYVALDMIRIRGEFDEERVSKVRQAALLCDDLLMNCERFRVCEALEAVRREGQK